jgi:hypothetical protein
MRAHALSLFAWLAMACSSSTATDTATPGDTGGFAGSAQLSTGGHGASGGVGGTTAAGPGGGATTGGSSAVGGAGGFAGGTSQGAGGGLSCGDPKKLSTCDKPSEACGTCACAATGAAGGATCSARWDACESDPSCAKALACVIAACAPSACAALAGASQTKLVALTGCLAGACTNVCGGKAGTGGATSFGGSSGGAGKGGSTGTGGGAAGGGGKGGGAGAAGASATGGGGGAGGSATMMGGGGAGASVTCEPGTCAHAACDSGAALSADCSPCAKAVCDKDPYCCSGGWDQLCASQASIACGCTCGGAGGSGGAAGGTAVDCAAPTASPSAGACLSGDPAVECNPITGEPCDLAAGAVCDASYVGGALAKFRCYGPPNTQTLCEPCGATAGFCGVGLTCTAAGTCAKLCCTADDCGPNATCSTKAGGGFGAGICTSG